MLPITIVPQRREFGCAKAVIKTIIKTRWGLDVRIKDPLLYIKSLGTLHFLGMANDALRQNKLPGRFVKRTNVKFEEFTRLLDAGRLMIVLFISNENYPHYAVPCDRDDEYVFIANTHGAVIEKYLITEFIERLYLNTRYIDKIQWKRGQYHPIRDRFIRWSIRLSKVLGILKPGTVYILAD